MELEGIGMGLDSGVKDVPRAVDNVGLFGVDGARVRPDDFPVLPLGTGAEEERSLSALLSKDLCGLLICGLRLLRQNGLSVKI
jgi:hypothetical protein